MEATITIENKNSYSPNVSNPYLIALVGTNGTGKTSITKEIIGLHKEQKPKNKIIAFDTFEQFNNIDGRIKKDKNWMKEVRKENDTLVVLDDYKVLEDTYNISEGFAELLIHRRQQGNSYIYSCQSPSDIAPRLIAYTEYYYVFYTKVVNGKFNKRQPFSDLLISASEYVNKYVAQHGQGKHKNDPSYDGQGFPYCVVNTMDGTITSVNMDKRVIV